MTADDTLAVLQTSHERLAAALTPLTSMEAQAPSYCDAWTIAQVASHLGSGAEIFTALLAAGRDGSDAPADFAPVWQVWDAKAPGDQVQDAVTSDAAFLDAVRALTPEQRASWSLEFFGARRDLDGMLAMRLGEHVIHTWDVEVAADDDALLLPDAVLPLLDALPFMAGMVGKPLDDGIRVLVTTSAPERRFLLDVGHAGANLRPTAEGMEAPGGLDLPAEALIRLVFGRLDPDHIPAQTSVRGVEIDILREAFPGF